MLWDAKQSRIYTCLPYVTSHGLYSVYVSNAIASTYHSGWITSTSYCSLGKHSAATFWNRCHFSAFWGGSRRITAGVRKSPRMSLSLATPTPSHCGTFRTVGIREWIWDARRVGKYLGMPRDFLQIELFELDDYYARKDKRECVVQTVGTAMDTSRGSCKLDTGTFLQELNQITFIVAGAEAGLFVGQHLHFPQGLISEKIWKK